MSGSDAALAFRGVSVVLRAPGWSASALADLDFELRRGECLAVVGESGSGKTLLMLAAAGLLPEGFEASGSVLLAPRSGEAVDLLALPEAERRRYRGGGIGLVFQEPATALHPAFTIGDQVEEALRYAAGCGRREARAQAVRALGRAGLPDPARAAASYPHQLSGGMRQRALIAMALAPEPAVLFADEPTSSLDPGLRAEILALLRREQVQGGRALVLISHDLQEVLALADRVIVLYGGRIVESGEPRQVFARPAHPYTRGLVRSRPTRPGGAFAPIPGSLAPLGRRPAGCSFADRCAFAELRCLSEAPELAPLPHGAFAACFPLAEGRLAAEEARP